MTSQESVFLRLKCVLFWAASSCVWVSAPAVIDCFLPGGILGVSRPEDLPPMPFKAFKPKQGGFEERFCVCVNLSSQVTFIRVEKSPYRWRTDRCQSILFSIFYSVFKELLDSWRLALLKYCSCWVFRKYSFQGPRICLTVFCYGCQASISITVSGHWEMPRKSRWFLYQSKKTPMVRFLMSALRNTGHLNFSIAFSKWCIWQIFRKHLSCAWYHCVVLKHNMKNY